MGYQTGSKPNTRFSKNPPNVPNWKRHAPRFQHAEAQKNSMAHVCGARVVWVSKNETVCLWIDPSLYCFEYTPPDRLLCALTYRSSRCWLLRIALDAPSSATLNRAQPMTSPPSQARQTLEVNNPATTTRRTPPTATVHRRRRILLRRTKRRAP